jgi:hypothetical protein
MPGVSYMRLDGGVEASKRFDVVKRFNADPTIDVLLLTTHGEPRQGLLNWQGFLNWQGVEVYAALRALVTFMGRQCLEVSLFGDFQRLAGFRGSLCLTRRV